MSVLSPADRLLVARYRVILAAEDQLIPFARLINPDPDNPGDAARSQYKPVRHHHVIATAMEEVEKGTIKRLIICCPPRHGKSELASKTFPAWYMGRSPSRHVILGTYNDTFATDFGRAVREIMNGPAFRQVFPKIRFKRASQAADRQETEQGGVLQFVGRGGSVTGRGGDLIILDDPIKDAREASSKTVRDQTWTWYVKTISTRMMTDQAALIIIATRWHEDDLIGRLTDPTNPHYSAEEAEQWRMINLPALAEPDDPLSREEGEALWPQRFSRDWLEGKQRQDPRGFAALYQGKPAPEDGAFFQASFLKTYHRMDMLPDELAFYAASDHAVSINQTNDRTCLMVVGLDGDNNLWIMPDLVWGRFTTDQAVVRMIQLMSKYQPRYWWGEKGVISKSIGPFLRRRMVETGVFCTLDDLTLIGDKQARAQSVHARMAMGKVFFPAFAYWYADARTEMLKFPHATFDDFVDTLSLVGLGLSKISYNAQHTAKRDAEPKVGTLAWIKWASNRDKRLRTIEMNADGW